MSLKKLIGILKVHEKELQQDEGVNKGKSLAPNTQKARKAPSSKKSLFRSSSKSVSMALSVDNSSNDESKQESEEDNELTFVSRKIRKMWKNKSGSRWKNSSMKVFKEKKDKEKSSIIGYECKKPRHFKLECPKLEKSKDKYKHYKSKEKKNLMSIGEDLDDTTSNEDKEEEVNLCLMDDTTSEELELE